MLLKFLAWFSLMWTLWMIWTMLRVSDDEGTHGGHIAVCLFFAPSLIVAVAAILAH